MQIRERNKTIASFHINCCAITKKCVTVRDFLTLFISKLIEGWIPFFSFVHFLSADKRSKKPYCKHLKKLFPYVLHFLVQIKEGNMIVFLGIKNIFCISTFCANKGKPFLIILN